MRDLGINCVVCKWFIELDKEELKDLKKYGYPEWKFWCKFDPGLYVIETLPDNYCSRFECICGGDSVDGKNHLDCLEIEFELE